MRNSGFKSILLAAIVLLTIAYPFVIFWGLKHYDAGVFASFLFMLLLLRFILLQQYKHRGQWILLIVVAFFCGVVIVFNNTLLLRYYPVLMSLGMSSLFTISLLSKTSLIERFAKLSGKTPSPQGKIYMHNLTKVWAGLLILNGVVAAYTACCMPLKAWTLYNGAISYAVLGGFMLLELLYRQYYKRKHAKLEQS